ncbi:hypothetical protein Ahy_B08g093759 [Arachis hypogaea]|uniref:Uncharacterized protein n=1 Tax=Arachis hypogaea TaxID=3818 RepID=A0A444Y6V7_ARAHY|nr:hypothetical protein Ahy_B08g093759 [Arachis hypogaea]
MSEPKKAIVRELDFGGLMHIPPINVPHKLLKELANSFKLGKIILETSYGSFKVKPKTIRVVLGLNASGDLFPDKVSVSGPADLGSFATPSYKELSEENKLSFRRFQGKTLKNLTNDMMSIGVENEQDRLMFKRIFTLYIQMAFLLPTTINKIFPVHLAPIFKMDKITEGNWGAHSIVKKAETKKKLKEMKEKEKKKTKNKKKNKASSSSESDTSETEVDFFSESESEEDSEEPRRKQPTRITKKKRKQILEDSNSETESNDETQSKKRKHFVEDSSPEQTQSYDGSELGTEVLQEFLRESKKKKTNEKAYAQGMPEVNLGSENDPLFQGQTDQSSINKLADSMLSLAEESASDPAQHKMMVVRMETHSQPKPLSIVPIQVYVPLSQTTATTPVPAIEPSPTKSPGEKISEERTKNNPAPKDAAALMMMAQTASYIPKKGPMPSFSLGSTDSSQEETLTQEGQGQPGP